MNALVQNKQILSEFRDPKSSGVSLGGKRTPVSTGSYVAHNPMRLGEQARSTKRR